MMILAQNKTLLLFRWFFFPRPLLHIYQKHLSNRKGGLKKKEERFFCINFQLVVPRMSLYCCRLMFSEKCYVYPSYE